MLDERFDGTQTSAELSRMPRPEQFGPESFDPERFDGAHRPERVEGLKTEGLTAEGRVEGQEIEAGTLLILACAVGWSFARMWKPGMNDIPHSGCLPLEEYLLERSLPLEADETFTVCGRPWLTLK